MSVKISVKPNDPLIVEGECKIIGSNNQPLDKGEKPNVALCRCGQSSTKPFCDGTHVKTGFTDPGAGPA